MTDKDKEVLLTTSSVADQLRTAYAAENRKKRSIKLPGLIMFSPDGQVVRMHMRPSCVKANMQDDNASFEGWALAVRRWLNKRVALSWDSVPPDDPHYQRFLYRASKFHSLFDWFSISPSNLNDFGKLKTDGKGQKLVLNNPSPRRRVVKDVPCVDAAQSRVSEHALECSIVRNPGGLMKLLGLDCLAPQRPVGVFRDAVKQCNAVFPGRHAAIDIWGVDTVHKRLVLFELKTHGNEPLGILSEMFFYSFVMEDVQRGRFDPGDGGAIIAATDSLEAYILAPAWHPLIDEAMISMINKAYSTHHRKMRFGALSIPADNEFKVMIPCNAGDVSNVERA